MFVSGNTLPNIATAVPFFDPPNTFIERSTLRSSDPRNDLTKFMPSRPRPSLFQERFKSVRTRLYVKSVPNAFEAFAPNLFFDTSSWVQEWFNVSERNNFVETRSSRLQSDSFSTIRHGNILRALDRDAVVAVLSLFLDKFRLWSPSLGSLCCCCCCCCCCCFAQPPVTRAEECCTFKPATSILTARAAAASPNLHPVRSRCLRPGRIRKLSDIAPARTSPIP